MLSRPGFISNSWSLASWRRTRGVDPKAASPLISGREPPNSELHAGSRGGRLSPPNRAALGPVLPSASEAGPAVADVAQQVARAELLNGAEIETRSHRARARATGSEAASSRDCAPACSRFGSRRVARLARLLGPFRRGSFLWPLIETTTNSLPERSQIEPRHVELGPRSLEQGAKAACFVLALQKSPVDASDDRGER